MVRKPCLYPNCLKSTRRREKHDNLPHYQCLECEAVAPRKLQSQHCHPSFTTQPLTRPPTPSICRNKPEPCWCSRCPIQESKNITRHKKTPHYICETCDSEGGKKVFIGEVIAHRHKRFHQGHIVSKIREGDRTEHTPLTSVNVSPENSAHRLNICLQPRLNDHTTANGAQASVELSRTRGPGRPSLEELAATLRESQRIVCVVGAGISTSAGSTHKPYLSCIRALTLPQFLISVLLRDSLYSLRRNMALLKAQARRSFPRPSTSMKAPQQHCTALFVSSQNSLMLHDLPHFIISWIELRPKANSNVSLQ